MSLNFKITKKIDGMLGRVGILKTAHGEIETPAFVVVGTKGTVKSLNPEQVKMAGAQVILANTYHLYLQPGDEAVKKMGGLGKMMNWSGPTMTDSGGFQIFSLGTAYKKGISKILHPVDPRPNGSSGRASLLIPERFDDSDAPRLAKIGPEGVSFTSHLDGSVHYLTPEKSIQIQHNLGADIIFAFDECTSPMEDLKYQEEALERTHNWAEKSLSEHKRLGGEQALFGIVQGGRDEKLRKKSAKFMSSLDFAGFGIGGSFAKEDMSTAVRWVNEILPEEKPRHLLGIGEPEDLFMGVENGVDLFDCVLPTRLGRNGTFYTKERKIHITNAEYRLDLTPVENNCQCYTCQNYSKAYIAHLFRGKEMLAGTLSSIHNIYFIVHLVKNIRQSILDDNFEEFKESFLKRYKK
ncbi:MAG: tRNA guanosine(34) transglycosylase Tgt [Candidatus Taylorbacteria bacterium RIFOXYD2_FULL_36_9]|uniref:Queuine tRNA-ribosyltransferase n=1 Tax=Candidatus Taylorbacteria bacterium RIFOXYD2_FULL_36_9 TaxID=1802338 RepID=A0A1G2PC45_9BACT|nr:MAG: tRNA guanosine(34) transglycosylase Tgt [Candidatus Taylorbacteria bacterium RIFOXYD2_FULL_36_9]